MAETNELGLQSQIQALIKATEDKLEMKTTKQMESIILNIETINSKLATVVPQSDFKIVGELKKDLDTLNENLKKNQEFIDNFIAEQGKRETKAKDFKTGWKDLTNAAIFSKKEEEIMKAVNDRNFKMTLDLKATMTLSSALTGDPQSSYNSRQGLVPSQRTNMRDLLNTISSPTGSFVTFRETGTSGSISVQTEGSGKTEIDYAFTEVKVASKYIAGWTRISKQLMYNVPFLQNTLPRLLLRDFYKKENDYLYDTMLNGATGSDSTPTVAAGGPANDIEEMIFWIANQRDADYDASYGIIDWSQWAHLMKSGRNSNSTYAFPLVASAVNDSVTKLNVDGVPIIGASYADAGELLLWDNDFVERVETESLRVDFSFEDSDNFQKNLVTVRVECFEELNILRPNAIIRGQFGGS